MKVSGYSKMFAAGAAMLLVSGGCASMDDNISSVSSSDSAGLKAAAKASKASQKAAKKGRFDEAVSLAEDAVFSAPQEAAYRARLGQAYQQAGRFVSAEQAFAEARMLGDHSAKTLVSHALSLTATGQVDQARNLLLERRSELPASDYGLALALLGEKDLSVAVLEDAVRNAPPSQQVRQNLGFAYALAGRWREAQIVAGRDLSPQALRERLTNWAQLARPGAYRERVAGILGVNAATDDAGMPVMLALEGGQAPEDVALTAPSRYSGASLAAVEPVAAPSVAIEAPATFEQNVALMAEQNMRVAAAVTPGLAPQPTEAVQGKAPIIEYEDLSEQKQSFAELSKAPKSVANGPQYVVQLGAYSTKANAERAWSVHKSRYSMLKSFKPADSQVTINGKQLHRVAATGVGSARDARSLCKTIRSLGGECIVRPAEGFAIR